MSRAWHGGRAPRPASWGLAPCVVCDGTASPVETRAHGVSLCKACALAPHVGAWRMVDAHGFNAVHARGASLDVTACGVPVPVNAGAWDVRPWRLTCQACRDAVHQDGARL